MSAGIVVVDDDVDNIVLLQDKCIGVGAVDEGAGRRVAGGKGRVKCGNFWGDVGDVVKEGVVRAIAQFAHYRC